MVHRGGDFPFFRGLIDTERHIMQYRRPLPDMYLPRVCLCVVDVLEE